MKLDKNQYTKNIENRDIENRSILSFILSFVIVLAVIILAVIFTINTLSQAQALGDQVKDQEVKQKPVCIVYFHGIGCPHCAKTDVPVLVNLISKDQDIVIIEYEIYQQQENAPLLLSYNNKYGSGLGIPLVIINKKKYVIGDLPIINSIEEIMGLKNNACPLPDGSSIAFEDLNLNSLLGKPKILVTDRILIKTSENSKINPRVIRDLLLNNNISEVLSENNVGYQIIDPKPVHLSGSNVEFEHAIKLDGWILQWNGLGAGMTAGLI